MTRTPLPPAPNVVSDKGARLRMHVRAEEARIGRLEQIADILAKTSTWPPVIRAAFVAALRETITPTMPGGDAT